MILGSLLLVASPGFGAKKRLILAMPYVTLAHYIPPRKEYSHERAVFDNAARRTILKIVLRDLVQGKPTKGLPTTWCAHTYIHEGGTQAPRRDEPFWGFPRLK